MSKKDEYHTVVISYLGDGKGKTETYYYGDAKAPIEPINDFGQLRITKASSITEITRNTNSLTRIIDWFK
ncbi:hypothetical protein [Glaciecola sp. 33A]|uniref:hypothetical protein n=1 Tax=Glaciecola sp. 33A TaxID=2057807 RepID=UPI000C32D90A|nr:hypothetical protein [Glaciecola sp. 33A]PKI01921.1 hypothetical protein CXF81_09505 [Glaciecola sp. 33A]